MEQAIYALLFLIPAYLVRFELFGILANLWELMFAAVFLVWLASVSEWRRTFRGFSIHYSPFTILSLGTFLLLLGLALGTAMSPEPRVSLGALKGWFVEPFLFAVMIRATLARPHQQKKALQSLAASGVFVAFAAIVYWFLGDVTFDGRIRAFYESPNMLATQIAPALLIVALGLSSKCKVQSEKSKSKVKSCLDSKLLAIFSCTLLALVLFLTRSLGAMISLSATLCVWWNWGKFWGKRVGILFTGVLLLAPFISLLIDPWSLAPSSLASRLMIWKSALFVARDYGLLGRGLGTFQYDYLVYQSHFPPYLEWAVPHPHNIVLGTLLAGGILGVLGGALILLRVFQKFREQFSEQSVATRAAFFVLFYLLLHGIVDNTLWRGDTAILWGSVLALILANSPKLS